MNGREPEPEHKVWITEDVEQAEPLSAADALEAAGELMPGGPAPEEEGGDDADAEQD